MGGGEAGRVGAGGAEGSGGAYTFVACLRHLTTDHAFLSRRSTAGTTLNIHLRHLGAQYGSSVDYSTLYF